MLLPYTMKKVLYLMLLSGIWFSCHKEVEPGCDTLATVTDLSSVGGCGFGFKLTDGSVVVPDQHTHSCGHKTNPLSNFQLVDGMEVKIGYEIERHHRSPCSAGTVVEITCIEALTIPEKP